MTIEFPQPFDAVVMLTWSDWKTEPRSNRYHYASRFARHLPVYFVQPDGGDEITFEPIEGHDITLVHVPATYNAEQALALSRALNARGVRRPLLWVYNVFFEQFIRRSNARLKVFHATEDYLSEPEGWQVASETVRAPALRVLSQIDLLVGVSEGVVDSYVTKGGYGGPTLVLRNGCDFAFWEASGAVTYATPEDGARVVLFQGGINARLDYNLLRTLAGRLPDWQFWFCGHTRDGGAGWSALSALPNVRHFGERTSEGIAELARHALVGIMPFRQDDLIRRSFPLKAYEYVACGLPVVTVPIDGLGERPDLFRFETTAEGFARAIEEVAPTRTDASELARRSEAARAQSYDQRFEHLARAIDGIVVRRSRARSRLNLLLVYDDRSTHVRTIVEHLEAFQKYSRHSVHLAPGTGFIPGLDGGAAPPDLGAFDAILIHYSVRVSIEEHLSTGMVRALAAYDGPKILFVQDEYENTDIAVSWIRRLGIDGVFTVVPLGEIPRAYPPDQFRGVDFEPTLTGYVPEDPALDDFAKPISERSVLIGYRGRRLPHHYGELGYEKYRIGLEMKRLSAERGLPVDIEVDDSRRIYGNDWYRFLGSCRATLGTESGANVFDRDGSLKRLAETHASMPFSEFAERFLQGREGEVRMNQVSPKIFESIRLRTALILFDGGYSGVVKPDRHFIPLRKDFSNVDEVFEKLKDVAFVEALTERAYRDVIGGGRYSYEAFVRSVDDYLDRRTTGRARARLISVPVLALYGDEDVARLWPSAALGGLVNETILGGPVPREKALQLTAEFGSLQDRRPKKHDRTAGAWAAPGRLGRVAELARSFAHGQSLASRLARRAWRLLPTPVRHNVVGAARKALTAARGGR